MTKVYKMSPDIYHEKFIEVMNEWIVENKRNVEGRYYVLRLRNNKRGTLSVGIWTIKEDLIKRLLVRLAWFYLYPSLKDAEIRRIEVLGDKIFYVIPEDIVKVLEYVPWKKVIRRDEINIDSPDDIFRLLDEISKSFSDETRNDLKRITENLKNYESYVEH